MTVDRTTDGPPPDPIGDHGSLPIAMLVVLVGMLVSAFLVPIVGRQNLATRVDIQRAWALAAAQSGIDAATARFRGASDAAGTGLLERLPGCTLSGDANPAGAAMPLRYRVTVEYHNADDAAMSCPALDVPTTAVLTSTGAGTPTGGTTVGAADSRTITAIYNFRTNNANVVGANVRMDYNTGQKLCLDAGVTPPKPTPGTWAQVQTCVPGSSRQQFAYTNDLNLKVVGSQSTAYPQGMCLEAAVPHATGQHVVFQPCANRVARQQWDFNDISNWHGTSDGVHSDPSYCINMQAPNAPGAYLVIGACDKSWPPPYWPDNSMGAGMAGEDTHQLVNYKQFGRCIDVTTYDVNYGYLISWPCHQAPDGNYDWNQKWLYTLPTKAAPVTTSRIRTVRTSDNAGYCLQSPLTTAPGSYVQTKPCAATGVTPAGMSWTMYGDTGDYATSYRIEDEHFSTAGGQHYCLAPTDPDVPNPDLFWGVGSKLKVEVCSASTLQKWNAPANFDTPDPLTSVQEK